MSTSEEIKKLEERQIVLKYEMAKSDPHLWGVLKKTLETFKENYPNDYDEYIAANDEFNDNEVKLSELRAKLDSEKELEEHIDAHIDVPEL